MLLLIRGGGGGDEAPVGPGGGGGELRDGRRGEHERPRSTTELVDSIGVVMHLDFADTAYARQSEVFDRLRELGVQHVREGVPVDAPELDRGLRRAARMGIRGTLVTDLTVEPAEGVAAGIDAMGGEIEAVEAPNELDVTGPRDWTDRLEAYLPALRAAARRQRPELEIVGPSFVDPAYHDGLDPATFDVRSLHPYPGGLPPESPLARTLGRVADLRPEKPIAFTETGYHNALAATAGQPPVSEQAAAVYLPRAVLSAFARGVERTFVYELIDEKPDPGLADPERHFGLLRHDFSRKPAFLALRNLIRAAERSPGPAPSPPPVPRVSAPNTVHRLALVRPDGSRLIALWRPVSVWDRDERRPIEPSPATVRVEWDTPVRDLSVLRPSALGEPLVRRVAADEIELELAGGVALLTYR